jgi:hypothetical protein
MDLLFILLVTVAALTEWYPCVRNSMAVFSQRGSYFFLEKPHSTARADSECISKGGAEDDPQTVLHKILIMIIC